MGDLFASNRGWIRLSEHEFVHRVEDWMNRVHRDQTWYISDFLTVREQHLLVRMTHQVGLQIELYGGFTEAERKRAILMPGDWYPEPEDFEIGVAHITGKDKHAPLQHRQILGSLLGLGIQRKVVGDIGTADGETYAYITKAIIPFVKQNFIRVGNMEIHLEVNHASIRLEPPLYVHEIISVASLRADAIVAQVCHWSRAKAQTAIKQHKIQLNFLELLHFDEQLTEEDILSIRGYGRVKILQIIGKTSRDRQKIEVGILRSNT